MKTVREAIIYGIRSSKAMLDHITQDLTGDEWTHRAVPKSNCVAWLVGHLILSERKLLTMMNVTQMPELPEGFEARFGRDETSALKDEFGDTSILMPLFDQHRTLLIEAVEQLSDSGLAETLPKPHPRFKTLAEYLLFVPLHIAGHCGQISTIRRSLGRPPLV